MTAPHPFLRAWRADDLDAFAALYADPDVAYWLGGALDRAAAMAALDRIRGFLDANGWGVWAILDPSGADTPVGAAGLQAVRSGLPLYPGVEATWRLLPTARGRGLVTQAMRGVLADGFGRLGLAEIVTFTSAANVQSQAVMMRLGFHRDAARDFDHPALAAGHPLRRHVVYSLCSADAPGQA